MSDLTKRLRSAQPATTLSDMRELYLEAAAEIERLQDHRAAQAQVDRGFQKHLDAVKAERDNLNLAFCNAVTRCEGAEATLAERTFERDNASKCAKEMAQGVVDAHAEIDRLQARVAVLKEALRPFAEFASLRNFDLLPDDTQMTNGSRFATSKFVQAKHFKSARAALSEPPTGETP